MTDANDTDRDEPYRDRNLADELLEETGNRLAEGIYRETGIRLDSAIEVDGSVVRAMIHGTELCEVSLDSWDPPDRDGEARPSERLGDLLFEEAAAARLDDRLVRIEVDRLREEFLDDIEEAFRARLGEEEALDHIGEVDLDVVELGHHYHHGDIPEVYGRGYPPFGLEVWCWDLEREIVVEFGHRPGEVDELAGEAVKRLLSEATR